MSDSVGGADRLSLATRSAEAAIAAVAPRTLQAVTRLEHGRTRYFLILPQTPGQKHCDSSHDDGSMEEMEPARGHADAPRRVVLLLHGYTQSATSLLSLAANLALQDPSAHIVSFDRYGDGLSDCPAAVHTPELFHGQALQLLDHLGLGSSPFAVVGTSLGGILAAGLCLHVPNRVTGVGLINPGGTTASVPLRYLLRNPRVLGARWLYKLGRLPLVGEATVKACQLTIRHVLWPLCPCHCRECADTPSTLRADTIDEAACVCVSPLRQPHARASAASESATRHSKPAGGLALAALLYLATLRRRAVLAWLPVYLRRWRSRTAARVVAVALGLASVASLLRRLHPLVSVALVQYTGLDTRMVAAWVRAFGKERYAHSILSTLRSIPMLDDCLPLYRALGRRRLPVAVVWGTHDCITPYSCARVVLEAIPTARLHTMDGCGHGPYATKPGAVAAAVMQELTA